MGRISFIPLSAETLRKTNQRGQLTLSSPTAVIGAQISRLANDLCLNTVFRDGGRLAIPTARIEEFDGLEQAIQEEVEISPSRDTISIRKADVDIYVPGLLTALCGNAVAGETGRRSGESKSEVKNNAVREKGRKGGRPRRTATKMQTDAEPVDLEGKK